MQIYNYTSNAKINLGLQILNKREDGYHNLHSLFVELSLADELIFTSSSDFKLSVDCANNYKIPLDNTNLISRAYKLIRSETKLVPSEYTIHLKKKIPPGSGLGGGSSNAAAVLNALNELWKLNYSSNKLEYLGAKLGADIPFFIRGGLQLAEGIGEKLTPQDDLTLLGLHFLLIIPPFQISTADAYKSLNKPLSPIKNHFNFAPVTKPVNWKLFENNFEKVIRKAYPEIVDIKENLQGAGALFAGLSGSGSTVFGVFDNLKTAELTREDFSHYQTFLTSPVFHS